MSLASKHRPLDKRISYYNFESASAWSVPQVSSITVQSLNAKPVRCEGARMFTMFKESDTEHIHI
jgi:hypothetical protein